MRLPPARRPTTWLLAAVLVGALATACSGSSGQPGALASADVPTVGPTVPPPTSGVTAGPVAGPPVPTTTSPFAQLTPGVVTKVDGVQQVLVDGAYDRFDPGVVRVHPGKVRFILRNGDQEVHNMIFPDNGGARTGDVVPNRTGEVTVVLNKPGLYDFVCSFHELYGMRGQVKVE